MNIGIPAILLIAWLFAAPSLQSAILEPKATVQTVKTPAMKNEDVPALIKELGSNDSSIRSNAVSALGRTGAPAVPALLDAMSDINSNTRKGAAEALGNIGNVRPEVVPALIKLLIDRNIYVRQSAVDSLSKIGEPAIPFIIKALSDKDNYTRQGAADALGNIKSNASEIVPSLRNAIRDSDCNVRRSAAEALEKRQSLTEDLKAMRYVLDLGDSNRSSDVRINAIEALDKIGAVIPEVVPAVTASLKDSDYLVRKNSADFLEKRGALSPSLKAERYIFDLKFGKSVVRIKAVEALGKLGAVTPEVVPAITNMVGDKDVCESAIKALGEIGPESRGAIPNLVKALSDTDSNIRAEAAEALGKIGPSAKTASQPLLLALNDGDPLVRTRVAEALRKLGIMTTGEKIGYFISSHPILATLAGICSCIALFFGAWFSIPLLWKLCFPLNWYIRELHNPDNKRRAQAAEALAKIGNSSIPFLIKMLENKNSDIRISAAEALNEFRSLPPEANTLILKSMRDKEEEVRRNILEILGKTVPATTEAIQVMIKSLQEGGGIERISAAKSLGRNGQSREAIIALKKAVEDSNNRVREQAYNSLENFGALSQEIKVKRFVADLGDRDINICDRAVRELAEIGAAAIPELTKALDEGDSNVRRFAASLLEQLDSLSVELKVRRYIHDLGDNQISVIIKASEALGNIGAEEAAGSIPHLSKLISSNDYYVRSFAFQALEKMNALTPELWMKKYNLDLQDNANAERSKAVETALSSG